MSALDVAVVCGFINTGVVIALVALNFKLHRDLRAARAALAAGRLHSDFLESVVAFYRRSLEAIGEATKSFNTTGGGGPPRPKRPEA